MAEIPSYVIKFPQKLKLYDSAQSVDAQNTQASRGNVINFEDYKGRETEAPGMHSNVTTVDFSPRNTDKAPDKETPNNADRLGLTKFFDKVLRKRLQDFMKRQANLNQQGEPGQ